MLVILTACNATAPNAASQANITPIATIDIPESEWGTVELIAQAEQITAPVFVDIREGTLFAWTGSEDGEARHFSRGVDGNSQIMALSAYFPQQQQLIPIDRGALMLWLDRNNSDFDLRLQVGTFSQQGIALVGSVMVSDQRTRNYDAIALDNEQVRIVWSGGLGEVTNLYLHHVDYLGRPIAGERLRIDADYPALIRDNEGKIHLFWLENNGRDAYHARFDDSDNPNLIDIQRIASNNLAATDAITHFSIGFDGDYAYLLWNIRRINDSQLVLISSGQLTDARFSIPVPLFISDGVAVQWISPATQTQSPLPMVANQNEDLLLLWMQNGAVQTTELITTSGRLIGLPYIATSEDSLAVTWSQATLNGYANLFYVSRPRNP